ncbi:hypothetical protein ARMGADRAFT_1014413 [Armillaria gallica]|uniref:Uncharacterized protein n=1 Tax=Armillaria gallica TaxID=47427 RepID=A0A2H3DIN9_ARMGA|nr:hypothetical protein ARMGADRAFT_1014413 [Armillaria gallica]
MHRNSPVSALVPVVLFIGSSAPRNVGITSIIASLSLTITMQDFLRKSLLSNSPSVELGAWAALFQGDANFYNSYPNHRIVRGLLPEVFLTANSLDVGAKR